MANQLNQALSGTSIRSSGDHLTIERPCMGSVHHSPRPLTTSTVTLKDDMDVDLCGTCQDNLRAYLVLANSYPDELPWILARQFGNIIRRFGEIQVAAEKAELEDND